MPFSLFSSCLTTAARISSDWRCVLGLILATSAVSAAESPSLKAAKTQFLKNLLTESQAITEFYDRALVKLETELAAAADYEEAALTHQRREEIKAVYLQAGMISIRGIPLPVEKARLTGSAEAEDGIITNWRSASSGAEWQGIRVTPGSYFLELQANLTELPPSGPPALSRLTPQEKASFTFSESSLLLGAQENRRTFDISMSAADVFSPIRVGPIMFTRSPVTLRLVPATGYPGNRVQLRQIQLIPAEETSIQAASLPEDREALDQAKYRLAAELERAQKTALASYEAKLSEIGKTSPDLKEAAAMETKRLQNLQQKDPAKPNENLLYRMLARLGNTAGFEDLENAQLISDDQLTGDHFKIEHEGKKILVRLLWVQCAPLDSKSEQTNDFAKHFSIDSDDAPAMGRSAREFTLGYLDGKPLRLLLRPNVDKDGSRPALVFLSDVGLYQNVLVDHGLAAVHAPMKDDLRGTLEKGLISNLLDRETAAKKRKSGVWALKEDKP